VKTFERSSRSRAAVRASAALRRGNRSWTTSLDDLSVEIVRTRCGPMEVALAGNGPAVLMLHGIPGSWRQCVPLAEDLVGGFRVVLPSRPGYGRTPIATGRTYDEQAEAFAALLDALGIERYAVFGISGGGPGAIALAARQHERVTALVLACAMVPHLMRVPGAMRFALAPGIAEVLAPLMRRRDRRRIADEAHVDAQLQRSLTPQELVTMRRDPSLRDELIRFSLSHQAAQAGLAGLRNDFAQIAAANGNGRPAHAPVTCPTLVLAGDADTVVSPAHAAYHADALPSADHVTFENAGHVFALTRRDECSALIRCFLERQT
jgi:pimeloyl-ACP methyl ester carboxylesterase